MTDDSLAVPRGPSGGGGPRPSATTAGHLVHHRTTPAETARVDGRAILFCEVIRGVPTARVWPQLSTVEGLRQGFVT